MAGLLLRRALQNRRVAALALALTLASAGCGDLFDDDSAGPGDGSGSPATGSESPGPGEPGGPGGSDTTSPTVAAGPGPVPTTTPETPAAERLDPGGPVGAFGPPMLSPDHRVRIDLLVEAGAAPTDRTVPAVRAMLGDVTAKAVAVSGPVAVPAAGGWTAARIRQAGAGLGGPFDAGEAGFRLLFLKGSFADDDSVLGVAVNASTAALFTDKIAGAAGLLGDRARFEIAVATHEIGHLLGLVDIVVKSGRQDPDHPGHSRNRDSVMFWAVESDLINTLLTGGPPTTFDADDRAELDAIRRR